MVTRSLQNVEDIYPLTPMQRAMLGTALAESRSVYHHEQYTFVLEGPLSAAECRAAWRAVVDRHAVLRSCFVWPEGERAVQVVMRSVELPWEELDWNGCDERAAEERLGELLTKDRAKVFSMMHPPLCRVRLVRLGPERHRVVWSFHHIVADAWSVSVLLDDVASAYGRLVRGLDAFAGPVENIFAECAALAAEGAGEPEAAACVVDGKGCNALAAAFVGSAEVAAVRGAVSSRLPGAMVPSRLVRVDALPRTPNGKLDRVRLRAMLAATEEPASQARGVEPASAEALTIASHSARVLGRDDVGPDDGFFDLGGHSLLAVRLAQRVEATFSLPMPLNLLLSAPTPRALAAALASPPIEAIPLIPIRLGGSGPTLGCVHGADGNVLFVKKLAMHLDPEVPLYGLMAAGLDGVSRPRNSVHEMAVEYASAVRAQRLRGALIIAGYSLGGVIAVEMARRLSELRHDVLGTVLIDTGVPLAAAGRSLRKALPKRVAYHLRRGPRATARSIFTAYVQKAAYRTCAALGVRPPVAVRSLPVGRANVAAYIANRSRGDWCLFERTTRRTSSAICRCWGGRPWQAVLSRCFVWTPRTWICSCRRTQPRRAGRLTRPCA